MPFHFPRTVRRLLLVGALCLEACGHKGRPAPEARPPAAPESPGITLGPTFNVPDVLAPGVAVCWAHQDADLEVRAPEDGCYWLTFRPFTVFTMAETVVQITADGRPAGEFSTRAFDLSQSVPVTVELSLHAGVNRLHLHASQSDRHLGEDDERLAAYGFLLPITTERLP